MTATPVATPSRTVLKAGLVLGTVLVILNLVPSLAIGFDGAGWDPEVITIAVVAVVAAVAILVLLPFAWRGRRGAAIGTIVVLALTIVPALPAFFLPADVVPVWGVLVAVIGILLTAVAIVLVALGMRRAA